MGQYDKVCRCLTVLSIYAVPFVFVHMYTTMASQDSSKIKQRDYLVMARTVKLLIINENGLKEIDKKTHKWYVRSYYSNLYWNQRFLQLFYSYGLCDNNTCMCITLIFQRYVAHYTYMHTTTYIYICIIQSIYICYICSSNVSNGKENG